MALKVLGDEPIYLETEREMRQYLDSIFSKGSHSESLANVDFQIVQNTSADRVARNIISAPDNVLSIGIDHCTGYGGILWYCDGEMIDRVAESSGTDVARNAWVSLNENPPKTDPRVLSDPSCPSFFDRVSALPLLVVRLTVEDYFREGSGFRPRLIQWTKGHFTGELYTQTEGA
ncbi:Imm1 family immunity protein [Streptomyces sp. NPDC085596]|uniref:Imm1 family immunity protein n=1 Tax=Streptomyces sp. NPDC085596 TaxID=3365731 RepID=UPI0037D0BE4E